MTNQITFLNSVREVLLLEIIDLSIYNEYVRNKIDFLRNKMFHGG